MVCAWPGEPVEPLPLPSQTRNAQAGKVAYKIARGRHGDIERKGDSARIVRVIAGMGSDCCRQQAPVNVSARALLEAHRVGALGTPMVLSGKMVEPCRRRLFVKPSGNVPAFGVPDAL